MSGEVEVVWTLAGEPVLSEERVRRAVGAALAHGGRPGAGLSVVFVDDPTLAELHARHLGDPSVTDVMSFDLGEDGEGPAGEVYVSVDRARAVGERRGAPLERELLLYLVHGTLHLCGFDDHSPADRRRMRAAERAVLEKLGFASDPLPHELGTDDPAPPSTGNRGH